MSIDIYAATQDSDGVWGPVTRFEAQNRTVWIEDEDGMNAVEAENPLYKPDSGLSTSSIEAYNLLDRLGLSSKSEATDILDIEVAISAAAVRLTRGAADALAVRFLMLAVAGRERGATHIVVG